MEEFKEEKLNSEFNREELEKRKALREKAMEILKRKVSKISEEAFGGDREELGQYFTDEEKDQMVKEAGVASWTEFKDLINEHFSQSLEKEKSE